VTGYASGLEFALDNRGYFYCHETSMVLEEHRVLFHLFGKPGDDQVVFRRARSRESRMILTADTMHLGVIWMHGEGDVRLMDFWIARRDEPKIWRQVFADKSLPFSPILKFGRIFALSYVDAPNGRLVELSEDGQQDRELIPEQKTRIRQLVISANRIYTMHFDHPVSSIRNWSLSGTALGEIGVTDEGTIQLLPGRRDDGGLFYTYESFTEPCIIFERMPDSAQSRVWHRCSLPFERKPIQVRHVSYLSGDSVQIPMTLVAMGDPEEARSAPVVMTSYGGFGVPTTPQFSVLATILIEAGAILALPHIRGGCEFGEAWHKAARGAKRQVSFDDFTAAAQRLCDTGITSPDRLAIFGGSNSGLLVGAAMTQRPELFRAVLSIAPLLDMVRYEHFDRAIRWRREYGTVENPDDFRALHQYSPYHCIEKDCDYPATMFVSGDKDDRCNPAHVRKMAARLQERSSQTSPVIVDYSEQRGHAPALPLSTRVDALARRIAFLCKELNISMDTGGNHEATCD
jgi:prolyl oligopeptidase